MPCGTRSIPLPISNNGSALAFIGENRSIEKSAEQKKGAEASKKLTAFAIVVTYIPGDADGDGVITAVDATLVLRYLVKLSVPNVEIVERNGDIDGEGLDITDATLILRHVIEADVPYPVGSLVEQIL